jgi:hypothetical protein
MAKKNDDTLSHSGSCSRLRATTGMIVICAFLEASIILVRSYLGYRETPRVKFAIGLSRPMRKMKKVNIVLMLFGLLVRKVRNLVQVWAAERHETSGSSLTARTEKKAHFQQHKRWRAG